MALLGGFYYYPHQGSNKIVDTNSAARKIKDKLEAELDENFKLEK